MPFTKPTQDPETLLATLTALPDYRAEAVAAELLENGLPAAALQLRSQSTFRRGVSTDMESVEWEQSAPAGDETSAAETEDYLVFYLNREGLYDMLPEALFHQSDSARRNKAPEEMSRELRLEEEAARRFFSPLEHEFYRRGMQLELEARNSLRRGDPDANRALFRYFFGDPAPLTDAQVLTLLHILPLAHKIRGDARLISACLSRIFGLEVTVEQTWCAMRYRQPQQNGALGQAMLGVSSVTNDQVQAARRQWEIRISGIGPECYPDFVGRGHCRIILDFLLEHFLPAGAPVAMHLQCLPERAAFQASETDINSYLAFNSFV